MSDKLPRRTSPEKREEISPERKREAWLSALPLLIAVFGFKLAVTLHGCIPPPQNDPLESRDTTNNPPVATGFPNEPSKNTLFPVEEMCVPEDDGLCDETGENASSQ